MGREEKQNKLLFEEMPVPKAVMTMAVPTIVAQLIILIYNMADTFFIGRTNDPFMVAGASLILPLFNVTIAVANIAGVGGGTLVARLLGRAQPEDARKVASFSLRFSAAGGALFSVLTALFMTPLLRLLGASGDTFDFARKYALCVIVVGAVPTVLSMTMGNLLRNVGCARQAGFGVSLGGVINILLDPLFMFVILPRGNEILGAGIATALSNCITCAYFLAVIARLNSPVLTLSQHIGMPKGVHLRSFFTVGLPAAVGPFLFDLDYIVIDRLMAAYSDRALAAVGIVLKVERLPLNAGVGLCLGMVPLAAYNYAAGNLRRMDEVLTFTRRTGIVISLVSIVLYELFAPDLIRVFLDDALTVEYGSRFLRIRALATIVMFLSFIYVHFFQGVGRGGYALFLAVSRWALVNIPMLFLFDALFGMLGIVWAQFVSDCAVAFGSFLFYRRFRKKTVLTPGDAPSPG
ncbi:MAG: MATE family efflux transporter [Oscillospiraceae bacterium]|nr:MATE family efflux transporter [Oscillospiraceae bacterium]